MSIVEYSGKYTEQGKTFFLNILKYKYYIHVFKLNKWATRQVICFIYLIKIVWSWKNINLSKLYKKKLDQLKRLIGGNFIGSKLIN